MTGGPSKKTSYVVVGENAGESKLKKVKELGLSKLSEDDFLKLIGSRKGGVLSEADVKKQEKDAKKVAEQAEAMAKREAEEERLRKRKEKALEGSGLAIKSVVQLWTACCGAETEAESRSLLPRSCGRRNMHRATRRRCAEIRRLLNVSGCGSQNGQYPCGSLQAHVPSDVNREKNYKSGFKKPGKDGMGMFRAVLISGPPGIGKTTAAHLMATQAGYNPLELNASDTRSKKLIEVCHSQPGTQHP